MITSRCTATRDMVEMPITWLFCLEILRRPQAWCLLLAPTLAHPRLVLFLVQSFFFFLFSLLFQVLRLKSESVVQTFTGFQLSAKWQTWRLRSWILVRGSGSLGAVSCLHICPASVCWILETLCPPHLAALPLSGPKTMPTRD